MKKTLIFVFAFILGNLVIAQNCTLSPTIKVTPITCSGDNSGAIEILSSGCPSGDGGCFNSQVTPHLTCSDGTRSITSGSNVIVETGEVVTFDEGFSYNGDLIIKGGTVIVCGNAVFQNVNLENNAEIVVLGNAVFHNANFNNYQVTFTNYGAITFNGNMNITGVFTNYGDIAFVQTININNPNGSLVNYGGLTANHLINNKQLINYGVVTANQNMNLNSASVTENHCTIHVGNTLISDNNLLNSGSLTVSNNLKINSGSVTFTDNAFVETQIFEIQSNAQVSGSGLACKLIKVGGNYTNNGQNNISNVEVCLTQQGPCSCTPQPLSGTNDAQILSTINWIDLNQQGSIVNNLSAGIYRAEISCDASCIDTVSITLENPQVLNATVLVTPTSGVLCQGTASVVVSGGVMPYTVDWGGLTPLAHDNFTSEAICAGTYEITITDARGCSINKVIEITTEACQPDQPQVEITPASCAGDDGAIRILNDGCGGVANTCFSGPVQPPYFDCSGLNLFNGTINSGQVAYLPDGFNSHLNINGGTIVICGSVALTGLTMNGDAELIVLGSLDPSGNINYNSSNVRIANYGTIVTPGSFAVGGVFDNYGTVVSGGDLNLNSSNLTAFNNYGVVQIASSLNLTKSLINYGSIVIGSNLQNNGEGILENYCSITANGAFNNSSFMRLVGSLEIGTTATLNTNGNIEMYQGAHLKTNQFIINNQVFVEFSDQGCALIEYNSIIDNGGIISPEVEQCNTSNGTPCGCVTGSFNPSTGGGTINSVISWTSLSEFGSSITNLPPDDYPVTITCENGCVGDFTFTVPSSCETNCDYNFNVSTVSACENRCNGKATITLTNVNPSSLYQFVWSHGLARTYSSGNSTTLVVDTDTLCPNTYTVEIQELTQGGEFLCSKPHTVIIGESLTRLQCGDPDPEVTWEIFPSCDNDPIGRIELFIDGLGVSNRYKFLWSTGDITQHLYNQYSGDYSVTIYDDFGDSYSYNFEIGLSGSCPTETKPCKAILKTARTCSQFSCDGAIRLTNLEGQIDSFVWTNSNGDVVSTARNLLGQCPGEYKVSLGGASCDMSYTGTIQKGLSTTPCDLRVYGIVTDACLMLGQSGKVQAIATGGYGTLKYSWDPIESNSSTISGLDPGTYFVTVIDELGNTASGTFIVKVNVSCCPDFDPRIRVVSSNLCGDGVTLLEALPSGSSYSWNTSSTTQRATVSVSGKYVVTIQTSEGCVGDASYFLNPINRDQIPTIESNGEYICAGESVTLTAPAASTYLWNTGATSQSIDVTQAGYYSVTLTQGECSVEPDYIYVNKAPEVLEIGSNVTAICDDGRTLASLYTKSRFAVWTNEDGDIISSSKYLDVSKPGTYYVEEQYPGCDVRPGSITINVKEDCPNVRCEPGVQIDIPIDRIPTCNDFKVTMAIAKAKRRYDYQIEVERARFRQAYLNHFLSANEKFELEQASGDIIHHFTLYYYDRAGNLVKTVSPEGVNQLSNNKIAEASNSRNDFSQNFNASNRTKTSHDYESEYTFNSLNAVIAQNIPDHDPMNKVVFTTGTAPGGVNWTGGAIDENGEGILLGEVGGQTVMYFSKNGSTWRAHNGVSLDDLKTVYHATLSVVYAAGKAGTIIKSSDAGLTWETRSLGENKNITKIFFANNGQGHVLTDDHQIYSTLDDGVTWEYSTSLSDISANQLVDIHFRSFGEYYVLFEDLDGKNELVDVYNNGQDVDFVTGISTLKSFNDIVQLNRDEFLIAGDYGLLLHYSNGNFELIHTGISEHIIELIYNGGFDVYLQTGNKLISYGIESGVVTPILSDVAFVNQSADVLYAVTSADELYTSLDSWASSEELLTNIGGVTVSGSGYKLFWKEDTLFFDTTDFNKSPCTNCDIKEAYLGSANGAFVVAGTDGEVWTTTNISVDSPSWISLGDFGQLRDIEFDGLNSGVMATSTGIYETEDGGQSWVLQSSNLNVSRISKLSEKLLAIQSNPTNSLSEFDLVTSSWLTQEVEIPLSGMRDLAFDETNTLIGYGVGQNEIIVTTDGVNWKYDSTGVSTNLVKIGVNALTNSSSAVTIDSEGNLYRSSAINGWVFDEVDEIETDVQEILVRGSQVLITTEDKVLLDGTSSWAVSEVDYPQGVSVSSSGTVVAVGELGYISYNTSGMSSVSGWSSPSDLALPKLNDVTYAGGSVYYAVGDNGVILKSTNKGANWVTQTSNTSVNLVAVDFISTTKGLAVGSNQILSTTDGGNTWSPVTETGVFNDVTLVNSSLVFVVGNAGQILSSGNGGISWSSITNPDASGNHLFAIESVNDGIALAVGDQGTILKYTTQSGVWTELTAGNGNNWPLELVGTSTRLNKVSLKDFNSMYVGGEDGLVIRSSNGGALFTEFNSGNTGDIAVLTIDNDGEGFVASADGVKTVRDQSGKYTSEFYYDELGRLMFSQNSRQFAKPGNVYSYVRTDELNRTIESGEVKRVAELPKATTQYSDGFGKGNFYYYDDDISYNGNYEWLLTGEKTEVTRIHYDVNADPAIASSQDIQKSRNRITSTSYMDEWVDDEFTTDEYVHATHYDYDILGNAQKVIQDLKFAGLKKIIDYDFDLVSGNVNQITYQRGGLDQFMHRYEYDADNRITDVFTSNNGVIWNQDAEYSYYQHGSLARVELGDLKVQASDYAYTIQGYLKGMNSNTLNPLHDVGMNVNQGGIPVDEFGYSLQYFDGDYTPIGSNDYLSSLTGNSLYNGNINAKITATRAFMSSGGNIVNTPDAYRFKYDQLNRLVEATHVTASNALSSNDWSSAVADDLFKVGLSYDANGNILSLARRDANGSLMDDFDYSYQNGSGISRQTNRLLQVADAVTTTASLDYGDLQHGQQANNYAYDETGQLLKDDQEGIAQIAWTVDGKVKKITRTPVPDANPDLEFIYGADRRRIGKIVKPRDSSTGELLNEEAWTTQFYVADASGLSMAIYKQEISGSNNNEYTQKVQLKESHLYGASRLGIKNRDLELFSKVFTADLDDEGRFTNIDQITTLIPGVTPYPIIQSELGSKNYELTDHLGNVAVVVSDKLEVSQSEKHAIVNAATEYYPFGMAKPTKLLTATGYRYGFNGMEKDDEVYGNGNNYTTEFRANDPRIGGRWWSLDPVYKEFESPYVGYSNNPIALSDPSGADPCYCSSTEDPEGTMSVAYEEQVSEFAEYEHEAEGVSMDPMVGQSSGAHNDSRESIDEPPVNSKPETSMPPTVQPSLASAIAVPLAFNTALVADDVTGVGVADDPLLIPGLIWLGAATADYYLTKDRVDPFAIPIELDQKSQPITYVTYTKTNLSTGEVYVGRTSGYGDIHSIVRMRDASHHKTKQDFGPAVPDRSASSPDNIPRWASPAYQAIRGREQDIIEAYGGAWSEKGRGNTRSGNAINGISPINPMGSIYRAASAIKFGTPNK